VLTTHLALTTRLSEWSNQAYFPIPDPLILFSCKQTLH